MSQKSSIFSVLLFHTCRRSARAFSTCQVLRQLVGRTRMPDPIGNGPAFQRKARFGLDHAVRSFLCHAECVVAVALRERRDVVMSVGKHCVSASTRRRRR